MTTLDEFLVEYGRLRVCCGHASIKYSSIYTIENCVSIEEMDARGGRVRAGVMNRTLTSPPGLLAAAVRGSDDDQKWELPRQISCVLALEPQ
jgi:hypothetical protein